MAFTPTTELVGEVEASPGAYGPEAWGSGGPVRGVRCRVWLVEVYSGGRPQRPRRWKVRCDVDCLGTDRATYEAGGSRDLPHPPGGVLEHVARTQASRCLSITREAWGVCLTL
jgi:hypothetical protein